MADTKDLKSFDESHLGSSPSAPTNIECLNCGFTWTLIRCLDHITCNCFPSDGAIIKCSLCKSDHEIVPDGMRLIYE